MNQWHGMRILVVGAARQGLALARFLIRQGAHVTLNDQRDPGQMENAIRIMVEYGPNWVLGSHPLSLLDENELVCVSGGVPLDLPIVAEAFRRGMPVTNDSQIFMEAVPCPVIGITGSAGKTTTTTLVGRMASAAVQAPRRVWVGGNIGLPLVDRLSEIKPDDLVVLELSSFQTELMTSAPQIAAILNITPNHLDRHGTFEAYQAAKARLVQFQSTNDTAILNRDDSASWSLSKDVRGKLVSFGHEQPPAGQAGSFLREGRLYYSDGSEEHELLDPSLINLRGEHNLLNVLAACTIAIAAGFSTEAMRAGVADFGGVAHRLELVRVQHGVSWYNDSIATAPERTIAAIHSFNEPLVLLLGGRDKKLPWQDLAELIRRRVDHVVVFGEAADLITKAIGSLQPGQRPFSLDRAQGLSEAVQLAAKVANPGDVVLLSPGGTSFDEFTDFEQRGERYRVWVNQLS